MFVCLKHCNSIDTVILIMHFENVSLEYKKSFYTVSSQIGIRAISCSTTIKFFRNVNNFVN